MSTPKDLRHLPGGPTYPKKGGARGARHKNAPVVNLTAIRRDKAYRERC